MEKVSLLSILSCLSMNLLHSMIMKNQKIPSDVISTLKNMHEHLKRKFRIVTRKINRFKIFNRNTVNEKNLILQRVPFPSFHFDLISLYLPLKNKQIFEIKKKRLYELQGL